MQTENRLFDDFTRVASGALATLGGLRDEIEARIKERLERFANEMDLVTREEFDAVQAMAAKARAEQERLETRLVALEGELLQLRADAAAARAQHAGGEAGSGRKGKADDHAKEGGKGGH
jgi:BMFP domain-containing protein YqiC